VWLVTALVTDAKRRQSESCGGDARNRAGVVSRG